MDKPWLPSRLTGEHISLRPAMRSDAEGIAHLAAKNPDTVKNFSFFTTPISVARERNYLKRMADSPNDVVFLITSPGSLEWWGTCGIHDIDWQNEMARLGYILFNASAHGKGIAQDAVSVLLGWAFETLGLNKVYLNAFCENRKGLKLDLALGFQFEGRLRAFYKIHGAWYDVYHMSILKSEWTKQP